MTLSPTEGALLAAVGLAAGFLNTVAGGGSLLTLPALIFFGLDAGAANATNRVAVLAQSLAALGAFRRAGTLAGGGVLRVLLPTVVAASAGALVASLTPQRFLEPALLVSMCAMAAWLAVDPRSFAPVSASAPRLSGGRVALLLGLGGFYGGFLQAGVGLVLVMLLTGGMGIDLVRATALKVLVIGALTLVSLAIFVAAGLVRWEPGLWLGVGQVLGALLGARVALAGGARVLRWLVLLAAFGSAVAVALR
jgi:uncharacterized membrane protein YfcA